MAREDVGPAEVGAHEQDLPGQRERAKTVRAPRTCCSRNSINLLNFAINISQRIIGPIVGAPFLWRFVGVFFCTTPHRSSAMQLAYDTAPALDLAALAILPESSK